MRQKERVKRKGVGGRESKKKKETERRNTRKDFYLANLNIKEVNIIHIFKINYMKSI